MDKVCRKCAFRARRGTSGAPMYNCDYLYYTGKMRGCAAGEGCTRFIEATPEIDRAAMRASREPGYEKRRKRSPLYHLAEQFPNEPTPVRYQAPQKIREAGELPAQKRAQIAAELRGEPAPGAEKKFLHRNNPQSEQTEKERRRRYYLKNREKIRERNQRWKREHPEKQREYSERYRMKLKKAQEEKRR